MTERPAHHLAREERQALLAAHELQLSQVQERWQRRLDAAEAEHKKALAGSDERVAQATAKLIREHAEALSAERAKFSRTSEDMLRTKDEVIARLQALLEETRARPAASEAGKAAVQSLQGDLQRVRVELADERIMLTVIRDEAASRMQDLAAFVPQVSAHVATLGRQLAARDAEMAKLASDKAHLEGTVQAERDAHSAVRSQATALRTRAEEAEMERDTARRDAEDLGRQAASLSEELAAATAQMTSAAERSSEQNARAIASLRSELEAARADGKQQIDMLTASLAGKEKVEASLRAQLAASASKAQDLGSADAELKAARREITELKESVRELEEERAALQEVGHMFRQGSKDAKEREAQLQTLLNELKRDYNDALSDVTRLRRELDLTSQEADKQRGALQRASEDKIASTRSTYEEQISAATVKHKAELQAVMAKAGKEGDQLRQRIAKLEADAAGAAAAAKSSKHTDQEVAKLTRERDEFQQRSKELSQRVTSLHHEMATLQKNAAATKTSPSDQAAIIQVMEQQLLKLGDIIRAKDIENQQLAQTVQHECLERTELLKTLAALKRENEGMRRAGTTLPPVGGSGNARSR